MVSVLISRFDFLALVFTCIYGSFCVVGKIREIEI